MVHREVTASTINFIKVSRVTDKPSGYKFIIYNFFFDKCLVGIKDKKYLGFNKDV